MQLRPLKPTRSLAAAAAVAALAAAACSDGGPSDVTAPGGGPTFTPVAQIAPGDSVPIVEEIYLCKEGPAGTYTFEISSDLINAVAGNAVLEQDADDGTVDGQARVQVAAGTCVRIALAGGTLEAHRATVTVEELPLAGTTFRESEVVQLAGGVTITTTGANNPAVATVRGDEGAIVTFRNDEEPEGGEGCTPGYWKQEHHFDSWTDPYDPEDLFSAHFENAFPGMTLLEVLEQGGGGLNALGRHTVAALLNAASPGVDYDLSPAEVIDLFNDVHPGSRAEYNELKDVFEDLNEQGCPLN